MTWPAPRALLRKAREDGPALCSQSLLLEISRALALTVTQRGCSWRLRPHLSFNADVALDANANRESAY
jgi:hypothetical protein